MNIFKIYRDRIINILILFQKKEFFILPVNLESINVDVPPSNFDCDISCNAALILSKQNKKSPMIIGELVKKEILENDDFIEKINIEKPGFINIKFNKLFWNSFVKEVIHSKKYGSDSNIDKKKYLIEFVSANPTGPLHVGHCRGAILGDVLSNLLIFNNQIVTKEYYVNDYGKQIYYFSKSVFYRIREILKKEPFPDDKDLYPGNYIIDISNNIIKQNPKMDFTDYEPISKKLTVLSVNESLKIIKVNLNKLGISHDNFVQETNIVENDEVQKTIKILKEKKFIYEGNIDAPEHDKSPDWKKRNQMLFKSTDFGDDKDRALQKADKSWTYFASDVAYHNNKLSRKFDILVNILGADHAGYIKRISAAVEALSNQNNKLKCKVSQLVKLIKDGKPFKMSKRKGDYITVDDLINEVGKDATRFIMLNRSSDVELDFDFAKVKEKTKDNPLYYVQYCYARICSVFRLANRDINEDLNIKNFNFNYTKDEIEILKKISQWPKCIEISFSKFEPHRIPVFLYELSSQFHSYWNLGKENKNKRFLDENNKISDEKIAMLKSVIFVIKLGMEILGVETPEKM